MKNLIYPHGAIGFWRGRFLASRSFFTTSEQFQFSANRSSHLAQYRRVLDVEPISRKSFESKANPKVRKVSFPSTFPELNVITRSGLEISSLTSLLPFQSLFSLYIRTIRQNLIEEEESRKRRKRNLERIHLEGFRARDQKYDRLDLAESSKDHSFLTFKNRSINSLLDIFLSFIPSSFISPIFRSEQFSSIFLSYS